MKAKQPSLVRVERSNGMILVSFATTTIDKRNFATIVDEWEAIARHPSPQSVVIDLTGVRRIDELGLTVLQALQESIRDVGGSAVLCGPTDPLEQARSETRLARGMDDRDPRRRPPQWTQW